jgi:signal transduction histidine kinase
LIILIFYILSYFSYADVVSIKEDILKQKEINKQLKIISENQDILVKDTLGLTESLLLSINSNLSTSKKKVSEDLLFDFYYTLSMFYRVNNQFEKAIDYNYEAYIIAEQSNIPKGLAKSYLQFGELYIKTKDYDKASQYNLLGLKFCEDRNDTDIKYKFMLLLAKVYFSIGNYEDAEKYLLNAISETIERSDINIIAELKLYLSKIYIETNQLDKAEMNLLSIEKLSSKINNTLFIEIYRELISLYIIKKDDLEALKYALSALENIKKIEDKFLKAEIKLITSRLLINMDNLVEAKKYLELLSDYISNTDNLLHKAEYFDLYSRIYEKSNDYKSAFEMKKNYIKIKDKIIAESKITAINDALKKYESEKKDNENKMLKENLETSEKLKEMTTYIGIGILFVAVLVGIFAVLLYRRAAKERKMNTLLQDKNTEIESQKFKLESLNRELVDRNVEIEEINQNLIKSEAESRELNATKDKFLSIIAHDLKNPIAGIMLTSELLVNYYDRLDKEKLELKLKEINTTSVKLKDLLDTLLEWARASTGNIPYSPFDIEIDSILKNLGHLFSANLINKNITFTVENDTKCKVIADEKMLDTILRNLVSNAIKFTPEGGIITISTEEVANKLVINIKDTGVGIPEDKIPYLFSMSSNYSTLGTKKEKGTGLGLLLCKEFIEINNGTIEVSSIVGEGTVFAVSLNKAN